MNRERENGTQEHLPPGTKVRIVSPTSRHSGRDGVIMNLCRSSSYEMYRVAVSGKPVNLTRQSLHVLH